MDTTKPKKFYAVKIGRTPGVYYSWNDCKEQTQGYPGAIFKSFFNEEDAKMFLCNNKQENKENKHNDLLESSYEIVEISTEELSRFIDSFTTPISEIIAYVDGSYNAATKMYSSGVVIFDGNYEIHTGKAYLNPEMSTMRNVAGEICASEIAMKYALERGASKLTIYHDYEGIARWCTGDWQAKKEGTQCYKKIYDQISEKVQIKFVHVYGHTGNVNNEKADKIAKSFLGL